MRQIAKQSSQKTQFFEEVLVRTPTVAAKNPRILRGSSSPRFSPDEHGKTPCKSIFTKCAQPIDKAKDFCYNIRRKQHADLAHLVERDLAKVEVAGSSPVIRSIN